MRSFMLALLVVTNASAASFFVTNTSDSGPGSLRQAIVDANADSRCDTEACVIAFGITEPLPASGWFTIAPLTPLPVVSAGNVTLDGATQFAVSGSTVPLRPAVEISGEHLTGYTPVLELRHGCNQAVEYLAIDHSSGPGVLVGGWTSDARCRLNIDPVQLWQYATIDISNDAIGVDPTWKRAVPNERGIVSDVHYGTMISIRFNVVSGNRRSGIFLPDTSAVIEGNRIGTNPDFDDDIGNGASGIYAPFGATVRSNVIAYNRDFGVSVDSLECEVYANRIFGNGLTAISFNLKLGTAGPMIDSASAHVVTGHVGAVGFPLEPSTRVTMYSSFGLGRAGYGEAEEIVGNAQVNADGHFFLSTPADLTGRYVTASEVRTFFDPDQPPNGLTTYHSSRLSDPVYVKP